MMHLHLEYGMQYLNKDTEVTTYSNMIKGIERLAYN